MLKDVPTFDKGWKDKYFLVKREGLFGLLVFQSLTSARLGPH